jgi:DNA sulfur modification protein DndC
MLRQLRGGGDTGGNSYSASKESGECGMKNQENIFGIKKIEVAESIDLTIASLKEYGPRHRHWAAAWSWGKDSTTVVTLVAQLINTGQIPAPETFTIFCADTRMELTPLFLSAQVIMAQLRERGIEVHVVTAPLEKRFLPYILGRGVPPPNNNTMRWCTRQIKIDPMKDAVEEYLQSKGDVLMLTGVRLGESAVRDQRINVSCSRDGGECGQGWYQVTLQSQNCATLAPILHWRVCNVWDWLKIFAPMKFHGGWHTTMLADAYGGDEAEEINARTGCVGCPLTDKDLALDAVVELPDWGYLRPLKGLKLIYREMRKPKHRIRQPGGQKRKDGSYQSNQQRMGPLRIPSRQLFLEQILSIQDQVNAEARRLGRPEIDILNSEEVTRIRELHAANVWPEGWTGNEPLADAVIDKFYKDGSTMEALFK